ncbi:MAG TPA: hypothetical protein PLW81_00520 [Thiobacillaceae bacterium]|nr:hypothetical protein [Thiobacillaceae bacterium]
MIIIDGEDAQFIRNVRRIRADLEGDQLRAFNRLLHRLLVQEPDALWIGELFMAGKIDRRLALLLAGEQTAQ